MPAISRRDSDPERTYSWLPSFLLPFYTSKPPPPSSPAQPPARLPPPKPPQTPPALAAVPPLPPSGYVRFDASMPALSTIPLPLSPLPLSPPSPPPLLSPSSLPLPPPSDQPTASHAAGADPSPAIGSRAFAGLSALEQPFGRGFRMVLPETLGGGSLPPLQPALSDSNGVRALSDSELRGGVGTGNTIFVPKLDAAQPATRSVLSPGMPPPPPHVQACDGGSNSGSCRSSSAEQCGGHGDDTKGCDASGTPPEALERSAPSGEAELLEAADSLFDSLAALYVQLSPVGKSAIHARWIQLHAHASQ